MTSLQRLMRVRREVTPPEPAQCPATFPEHMERPRRQRLACCRRDTGAMVRLVRLFAAK